METIPAPLLRASQAERKMLAGVALLCLIASFLHAHSSIAPRLSSREIQGVLYAQPSLFLNYGPQTQTLDLVFIEKPKPVLFSSGSRKHPKHSAGEGIAALKNALLQENPGTSFSPLVLNYPQLTFSAESFTKHIKNFLSGWTRHSASHGIVWKIAHDIRQQNSGIGLYDLLLLGIEATQIPPQNIRPASLPEKAEQIPLLIRRFGKSPVSREDHKAVAVEILNGSGKARLGQELTKNLRMQGIDVVYTGNYKSLIPETKLLDRSGDWAAALKIQQLAEFQDKEVWTEIDPQRFVDVSIILGSDYLLK
ncbi:MAG: LytR C-terminal domain-containing protein [Elusimicrobia bacterium]|nr:LytR C-terminal domain-containing protein [Elusimicrobiota bacterium]